MFTIVSEECTTVIFRAEMVFTRPSVTINQATRSHVPEDSTSDTTLKHALGKWTSFWTIL
jgi:hypothetical protein